MANTPQAVVPDLPLRRVYPLAALVLTAGALLSASTANLERLSEGSPYTFWHPIIWELTGFYAVLLYLPIAHVAITRWPITRERWLSRGVLHLGVAFVMSVLTTSTFYLVRRFIYWAFDLGEYEYGILTYRYLFEFHKFVVVYAACHGFHWLYHTVAAGRQREAAAARLAQDLAEARLASLTAQVNPHFLFNCLNTISSLMYDDVGKADTMLSRLSDFLRVSLAHSGRLEVSLAEELRFVSLYVDLMQARFGTRLHVRVDAPEDMADRALPAFVLQPLVENAIKHHVSDDDEPIEVAVTARSGESVLVLSIADNGPGLQDARRGGTGLANLRARLEHLYGSEAALDLTNREDGGLAVTVRIPERAAQAATPAERRPQ